MRKMIEEHEINNLQNQIEKNKVIENQLKYYIDYIFLISVKINYIRLGLT